MNFGRGGNATKTKMQKLRISRNCKKVEDFLILGNLLTYC